MIVRVAAIALASVFVFAASRVSAQDAEQIATQAEIMAVFPQGLILPWYAKDGKVPNGWAICDGSNGTPDLRGRFLMGVSDFADVGKRGGEPSIPASPSHGHGGRTSDQNTTGELTTCKGTCRGRLRSHTHVIIADGQHNHKGENRPPYTTVLFIMKL